MGDRERKGDSSSFRFWAELWEGDGVVAVIGPLSDASRWGRSDLSFSLFPTSDIALVDDLISDFNRDASIRDARDRCVAGPTTYSGKGMSSSCIGRAGSIYSNAVVDVVGFDSIPLTLASLLLAFGLSIWSVRYNQVNNSLIHPFQDVARQMISLLREQHTEMRRSLTYHSHSDSQPALQRPSNPPPPSD